MSISWSPGLGDPTPMGLLTVAAYFSTALLCLRARSRVSVRRTDALPLNERKFWLGMTALLFALGLNKQLDLQSLGTEIVRHIARAQGWYEDRRSIQMTAIVVLVAASLGVLFLLIRRLRAAHASIRLATIGLIFTAVFVSSRAASFHHMDSFIGVRVLGLRMNWVLELSGIACIAVAALWFRNATSAPPAPDV